MNSTNPARPAKIRLNSWLWPILVVVLLITQILWPSRIWNTLLVMLGGIWVIAFFWTLSLARHLLLDRKMRYGWAQVGDRLEELFTITNQSRLPGMWLEVQDHSNMPDHSASRVCSIDGREILEWRTEGVCTRRGLFTLGPTSLHSGDPFGLCTLEITHPKSTVLLVLPPVLQLPHIEIASGGRAGEGRRPRRSAFETTVSVDTIREYIPGDPLKTIHWPTSARRNALYVRQFEHTPSSDWWIILDLEKGSQMGTGADSSEEHGVILAASLANRGLKEGRLVGLVTCGPELTWIPPRRSPEHLMDILRTLAVVHAGERPVADLLEQAQKSMRRGASVILITPDVQGEWAATLLQMARNGLTPTVLLFDPLSFTGTGSADGVAALLTNYGIVHNIIPRELFDRPGVRGEQGEWEWRVTGHGKTVAVRRPSDTGWRALG